MSSVNSSLSNILNSIIKGECNFCCLCFNKNQNITLRDELFMEINESGQNVTVLDILLSLLGVEFQEYLSTFKNVCEECVKTIINLFTFIKTSNNNATLLSKALVRLTNSLEYTNSEINNSKSLYVSLNLQDLVSKQLYDTKKIYSPQSAFKRFQSLNETRVKQELEIKKQIMFPKKPRKKTRVDIKTTEMIYDPHDQLSLKCKMCLKVYPTLWNLRNHFLRVHAPKNYKCSKCSRAYGTPALLEYHINESHCEVICSECGRMFKNRHSLIRHESGHHVKLVCPDCGRTYKNKVTYKKHIDLNVCKQEIRANPANAQFTCDYCNKKYTQKVSLRVHIQYEHGNHNSHVCKWCGKKFWAQSRLKAHIVKHTREKNFSCSICHGKFVTKESLLYHTRLHTGEKPYKCNECQCSFISASRRTYHMKMYHLGANVECELCNSKFTSRTFLHKHKKNHHIDDNKNKDLIIQKATKPEHDAKMNNQKKTHIKEGKNNNKSLIRKPIIADIEVLGLPNEKDSIVNNSNLNENIYQVLDNQSDEIFVISEEGNEYLCYI